jgi:hypothetical protein
MVDEIVPPAWFVEAEDMDTPAKRLAELAASALLQPLVAANPGTPAEVLTALSQVSDPAIRRAVARNPNTYLSVLGQMAGEFPQEFLHNPIMPFLHMTQPGFLKQLPFFSWASLLRFANLAPTWFQQVKNDKVYQRNRPELWKLMQLHVALAKQPLAVAGNVLLKYQKQLPSFITPAPEDEMELFFLLILLCPFTAPMLHEQWASAALIAPRQVGQVLSRTKEVRSKTLALLARQKNPFLLSQVARHPGISPGLLKSLATRKWLTVRRAVASNPRTPPDVLYRLLSEEHVSLRRVAVTHPALEALDLEIMALDKEPSVRAAQALLPGLTSSLFAQLAADPAPVVRAALARNLHISLELLSALAQDAEPAVRAAAASNPRLPVKSQAALFLDAAETVRASLSGNACLLADYAAALADDPSPTVRKYLAANPRTPAILLEKLWQQGGFEVGQGLARHPKASAELLTQLASQGDRQIQIAVAAHPQAPVELLAALAQKQDREIWNALAGNPHTPLVVLEQAVNRSEVDLWFRLINHPTLLHEKRRPFFALLAGKIQPLIARNQLPNWLRRVFLQYYTALPIEIVALFAVSPYWEERYLVARRPYLPESLLETLAQDGICYVRAAAREALKARHLPRRPG